MMDTILKIINDNQVAFLSCLTNEMIHKLVKNVHDQNKPTIFFTAVNKESLKCFHAQLNYLDIDNQLLLEDEKILKDIVLIDNELLYHYYTDKKNINIADVIIFFDSEVKNIYYNLLCQIYKNYQKLDIRLPRMILLDQGYKNNEIVLKKTKNNTYEHKPVTPKIVYNKLNFPRNDKGILKELIDNIKEDKNKKTNILLLVPSYYHYSDAVKLIDKEKKKDYEFFTFDEHFYESKRNKIFSPLNEKNRIIITTHKCAQLVHIPGLNYIYDSCQTTVNFYGNTNIHHISQKVGNHIAMEATDCVFRACQEDTFKHFDPVENYNLDLEAKTKIVLKSYQNNRDIDISHEEKMVKVMERLNLVRAGKVLKRSEKVISIPLDIRASNFILNWHDKELPLFPSLVLATILSECKNSLLHIPNTTENIKNFILNNYTNYRDDNIIIFYLNIFLSYFKDIKDLINDKEKIKSWCQENYIHFDTFNYLLDKLTSVVNVCRKYFKFTIGLYDSKKVFETAKPLIINNYSDSIYRSHDKVEHIYHDKNGQSVVLDKSRFSSGHFFFPESFISLYTLNNTNGHHISLFYLIVEN